jgi:hypothetical protein
MDTLLVRRKEGRGGGDICRNSFEKKGKLTLCYLR